MKPPCAPSRRAASRSNCKHFLDGFRMPRRRTLKNSLNCTRDANKGNGAFEECLNCDFIRCIEGNAGGAAGFCCLVGQAKTRKTIAKSGGSKLKLAECGHIEGQIARHPLGKAQAHTGWASRISVTEIWARMLPSTNSTSEWTADCGCTVTRTEEGGRIEQTAGFDDFQALVEQAWPSRW